MIFFAALALLVAAVLLPLAIPALQQRILVWKVRYRYKETVCRVVSREVGTELAARSVMHFAAGTSIARRNRSCATCRRSRTPTS